MKLAIVTASISREAGGLFFSVRSLAKQLTQIPETTVSVHGLQDSHWVEDATLWSPIRLSVYARRGPKALGYAPAMRDALFSADFELLHTQGIWQWPSAAVNAWHHRTGRPYIIAPRGMLDPWAMDRSRWKKRIASRWFENAHLRGAACLHALCEPEAESIRAYGLTNPICVIPNGIDLPDLSEPNTQNQYPKTLLFLGRLHPKKGLVSALHAWAEVERQSAERTSQRTGTPETPAVDWQFVIAGWDQDGHEVELKGMAAELGLGVSSIPAADLVAAKWQLPTAKSSVLFVGPAFGSQKSELLRRASAFILPSFSEGMPMSVLEAWAYGLPVLMTDHCNLPKGFAAGAAIRIGTDVRSIADGIQALMRTPTQDLRLLGANGRRLVEDRFTWGEVAAQMHAVYEWVLRGGAAPDCVVT